MTFHKLKNKDKNGEQFCSQPLTSCSIHDVNQGNYQIKRFGNATNSLPSNQILSLDQPHSIIHVGKQ